MSTKKRPQTCYLCGATDDLTREHVPPLGLFPKPRPAHPQLITVPCCGTCNNGHSKDDELFRLFVSAAINKNKHGRILWDQRVVPNTLGKGSLRGEIRDIIRSARPVVVNTPVGPVVAPYCTIPQDRILPSLRRIVKGLLWTYFPSVDYSTMEFEVQNWNQHKVQDAVNLISPFGLYEQRGDGVFRFWRGNWVDGKSQGLFWLLIFFDSCMFLVRHQTPGLIPVAETGGVQ